MTSLERYQAQLQKCCRPSMKPEKVLTGIQKEALEREEVRKMWMELENDVKP